MIEHDFTKKRMAHYDFLLFCWCFPSFLMVVHCPFRASIFLEGYGWVVGFSGWPAMTQVRQEGLVVATSWWVAERLSQTAVATVQLIFDGCYVHHSGHIAVIWVLGNTPVSDGWWWLIVWLFQIVANPPRKWCRKRHPMSTWTWGIPATPELSKEIATREWANMRG